MRQRVNVLTQAGVSEDDGNEVMSEEVRERVERLESRESSLRSAATDGDDGVTPRQVAEAPAVKTIESRVATLEDDLADVEEYMYDWHEAAETYMRALRRVVEEELDVSLQSYMEAVEDDVAGDDSQ